MPHVSDVRATSHDRHDPMLVAALAAGDLAADERDQAIALTRACADCALLHDDLLALARATATAPPPVATRPRDFRLTPADAARLRPTGWRRLVAALSASGSAVTRPLGVGLATVGLAGLLIGNVSINLGLGSAASAPMGGGAAAAASEGTLNRDAAGVFGSEKGASAAPGSAMTAVAAPVASAAAASAAPQSNPESQGGAGPSGLPGTQSVPLAPIPAPSAAADGAGGGGLLAEVSGTGSAGGDAFRPQNILFGLAIVIGLALLVASRRRGRRTV